MASGLNGQVPSGGSSGPSPALIQYRARKGAPFATAWQASPPQPRRATVWLPPPAPSKSTPIPGNDPNDFTE